LIGAGLAVLAAAVLGYGWWHARTHADVWLRVNDHAGSTPQRLWADVNDAHVKLRDAAGAVLAEAALEPPHGLTRWTGPSGAVLDCSGAARGDAWQRCFDAQSRWMAQWAPRVSHARVMLGRCVVDAVPVTRKRYTDWWLWWVPLPHVGGTPVSHYTLELHVHSARCASATAP
jgi:hypothetical protein